jgi:DNA-directed RNA polymerase subunit delta
MENISQMSLLEVALKIMNEKGTVVNIYDLINEVLAAKGIDDPDNVYATQLYVDITTSSKFVYMGDDNWDLKSRQSLDKFDKDGAFFNPKGAEDAYDDDEDEEIFDDEDDEELDEEDEDEESDDEDEDEDDESEEDEDEDEESYDDLDSEDEESDEDDDNSIDEDKYNEYMDDYEDLYEA